MVSVENKEGQVVVVDEDMDSLVDSNSEEENPSNLDHIHIPSWRVQDVSHSNQSQGPLLIDMDLLKTDLNLEQTVIPISGETDYLFCPIIKPRRALNHPKELEFIQQCVDRVVYLRNDKIREMIWNQAGALGKERTRASNEPNIPEISGHQLAMDYDKLVAEQLETYGKVSSEPSILEKQSNKVKVVQLSDGGFSISLPSRTEPFICPNMKVALEYQTVEELEKTMNRLRESSAKEPEPLKNNPLFRAKYKIAKENVEKSLKRTIQLEQSTEFSESIKPPPFKIPDGESKVEKAIRLAKERNQKRLESKKSPKGASNPVPESSPAKVKAQEKPAPAKLNFAVRAQTKPAPAKLNFAVKAQANPVDSLNPKKSKESLEKPLKRTIQLEQSTEFSESIKSPPFKIPDGESKVEKAIRLAKERNQKRLESKKSVKAQENQFDSPNPKQSKESLEKTLKRTIQLEQSTEFSESIKSPPFKIPDGERKVEKAIRLVKERNQKRLESKKSVKAQENLFDFPNPKKAKLDLPQLTKFLEREQMVLSTFDLFSTSTKLLPEQSLPRNTINTGSTEPLPPITINPGSTEPLPPITINTGSTEPLPPITINTGSTEPLPPITINTGSSEPLPPNPVPQVPELIDEYDSDDPDVLTWDIGGEDIFSEFDI